MQDAIHKLNSVSDGYNIDDRQKIKTTYKASSVKDALYDLYYDKDSNIEISQETQENFDKLFKIISDKLNQGQSPNR